MKFEARRWTLECLYSTMVPAPTSFKLTSVSLVSENLCSILIGVLSYTSNETSAPRTFTSYAALRSITVLIFPLHFVEYLLVEVGLRSTFFGGNGGLSRDLWSSMVASCWNLDRISLILFGLEANIDCLLYSLLALRARLLRRWSSSLYFSTAKLS